jgi:hypothetical protein
MPAEVLGKLRSKKIGQKAFASREFFRAGSMPVVPKDKPKRKRRVKPKKPSGIVCRCGSRKMTYDDRIFRDGTKRIEVCCESCRRFVKWI